LGRGFVLLTKVLHRSAKANRSKP